MRSGPSVQFINVQAKGPHFRKEPCLTAIFRAGDGYAPLFPEAMLEFGGDTIQRGADSG
jgi:hypothetical protein